MVELSTTHASPPQQNGDTSWHGVTAVESPQKEQDQLLDAVPSVYSPDNEAPCDVLATENRAGTLVAGSESPAEAQAPVCSSPGTPEGQPQEGGSCRHCCHVEHKGRALALV